MPALPARASLVFLKSRTLARALAYNAFARAHGKRSAAELKARRAAVAQKAKMVVILISSFLLLSVIVFAIHRWQRAASNVQPSRALQPPRHFAGFFTETVLDDATISSATLERETEIKGAEQRASILERAAQGDKASLNEAHATGDASLYDEALNALVEYANSDKSVLSLASYITRNDGLRVNARLAERFIETWKHSPDRSSTAKMLHVTALADDAALYQQAIEAAQRFWRDGRLPEISAEELRVLFESEFWVLSNGARNSGTGFILKTKLAALRRELSKAAQA
jgi:hypothetical protein